MPAPVAWDCADEEYREHAYNCMALEIQTLRSALVRGMADPNHVYDPDDWEYTIPWQDRDQLAEDCEVQFQGVKRFKTLIDGPDKFCVMIDHEYHWFDTVAEAEAAYKADMADSAQ